MEHDNQIQYNFLRKIQNTFFSDGKQFQEKKVLFCIIINDWNLLI